MSNILLGAVAETGNDATPIISACVIGRNEGDKVAACGRSLQKLGSLGVPFETIFVDSASTDGSAELAVAAFDQVIQLEADPHLNASAGRHVGVLAARGTWIIHLDGDMTLLDDFLPVLADFLRNDDRSAGIVGQTRDQYPDGGTRLIFKGYNEEGRPIRLFGGACVLPREALLRAGNWNPGLYSNEEAELQSRLKIARARIAWTDTLMVDHHTARVSREDMLKGLFFAQGFLGKKYYGLGQVVAAAWRSGTLIAFASVRPELFVTAALSLAGGIALFGFGLLPALGIVALFIAYAVLRDGLKAPALYAAYLLQALRGITRYPAGFVPRIRHRKSRPEF